MEEGEDNRFNTTRFFSTAGINITCINNNMPVFSHGCVGFSVSYQRQFNKDDNIHKGDTLKLYGNTTDLFTPGIIISGLKSIGQVLHA